VAGHVARIGRRGMRVDYWWKSQKERDHWEDQDMWVDLGERMGSCGLARDRGQWRALVNRVVNLHVP
jgi:hypothetical protein